MLLLNGGELNGVRLLKEETVREMMSSQKGKGCVTIDSPYGLCINRVDNLLDDRMIYGHQGMSGDICANLYFDPQSSLVFAMVTNGCNNKIDDHICAISRKLFAAVWDVYGD
jgi:CubicO group peptidase (beta-lactamase class C family)